MFCGLIFRLHSHQKGVGIIYCYIHVPHCLGTINSSHNHYEGDNQLNCVIVDQSKEETFEKCIVGQGLKYTGSALSRVNNLHLAAPIHSHVFLIMAWRKDPRQVASLAEWRTLMPKVASISRVHTRIGRLSFQEIRLTPLFKHCDAWHGRTMGMYGL